MSELKVSDYREYVGSTASEIGYDTEVVNTRVVDYFSEAGQRIGLSISEPVGGFESTVLMPQTHDYRNEPLSIRRAEIMAHHLGARVALIEVPGTVGLIYPDEENEQGYATYTSSKPLAGSRQTLHQLKNTVNGDFIHHSRVQLDALDSTIGLDASDRLILFGESMGSVLATDMLRHIGQRGLTLDALVLHETVNAYGNHGIRRLFSLLNSLGGIEDERRNQYFFENEAIGHPIRAFEQMSDAQKRLDDARKKMSQQGIASLANGIGMRRGINNRLTNNLAHFGVKQPSVLLTRAVDSTVAHSHEHEMLFQQLQESLPLTSRREYWEHEDSMDVPLGHSFLVSLGRQVLYAQQLRSFIDDAVR